MSVPSRDLLNHYGRWLDHAQGGEHIDIEPDGRVIATLGPPRRSSGTRRAKIVDVFRASEPVNVDRFMDDLYGSTGLDDSLGDPTARGPTA